MKQKALGYKEVMAFDSWHPEWPGERGDVRVVLASPTIHNGSTHRGEYSKLTYAPYRRTHAQNWCGRTNCCMAGIWWHSLAEGGRITLSDFALAVVDAGETVPPVEIKSSVHRSEWIETGGMVLSPSWMQGILWSDRHTPALHPTIYNIIRLAMHPEPVFHWMATERGEVMFSPVTEEEKPYHREMAMEGWRSYLQARRKKPSVQDRYRLENWTRWAQGGDTA